MALEHHFYLDTPATLHELRDALVQAGIGFEVTPDRKHTSNAITQATNVTIVANDRNLGRPDNGIWATRRITFRDRRSYLSSPETAEFFETESLRGILGLLKAFPEADAYWTAYDAAVPVLLRRNRRLVLSQALTENKNTWDAKNQPYLAMVDLPYTLEPLGPWNWVRDEPALAASKA